MIRESGLVERKATWRGPGRVFGSRGYTLRTFFDAQQAAEKALKALLICRGVRFPYVHDLAELLGLVEQAGQKVPETVREAARLTRYAVVTRYPGLVEPVTWQEYEDAVAIAEAVVRWAQDIVGT